MEKLHIMIAGARSLEVIHSSYLVVYSVVKSSSYFVVVLGGSEVD